MATLQRVSKIFELDENTLLTQAQMSHSEWERWLLPINDSIPVGEDPSYDDDFQRIREEINKVSGADANLICQLAEKLLIQTCKDLRVITFYIWGRLHQEGEFGFAQGLELLTAMLEQFGTQLHPQRERSRKAALEWLGSCRVTDSLSLHSVVDLSVIPHIVGKLLWMEKIFLTFNKENRPDLHGLYEALEIRWAPRCSVTDLKSQVERENNTQPVPVVENVISGRDLLEQAKILAKYLRDQPGGWLAGHHLMKSVRWDTLTELPSLDASGRTRVTPPRADNKAHLKRLYLQKSWAELLEYTDTLMAQGINHLWLDVQWYAWLALVQLDSDSVRADILCRDLEGLLARLPRLEALFFNDGTPFANDVTRSWINKNVFNDMLEWKKDPVVTLVNRDDDVLMLEAEVLAKANSEGIEVAFHWLQTQQGYSSSRDRWLMRLLMARVSEQQGKNEMALHLLSELDGCARELTLEQWRPDLAFEVKAHRFKLLSDKSERSEMELINLKPEMDALLSGLISLDPARAVTFCR